MIKQITATGKFHDLPNDIKDFLTESRCVPDDIEMEVNAWYDVDETTGLKTGDGGFKNVEENNYPVTKMEWNDSLGKFQIIDDSGNTIEVDLPSRLS